MEKNQNDAREKRKKTLQFVLFMIVMFILLGFTIYLDSHPELRAVKETNLGVSTSIMIGKYAPYIIGGIILLLTIFRDVVSAIF